MLIIVVGAHGNANHSDTICFGESSGEIVISASGGSGGYNYSVSFRSSSSSFF